MDDLELTEQDKLAHQREATYHLERLLAKVDNMNDDSVLHLIVTLEQF